MPSALGDDRPKGLFNELQIDANATDEKVDLFFFFSFFLGSAINKETPCPRFTQCSENFLRDT